MNIAKSLHFVGIKGVGMASLAIIAKEAGWRVTGSDVDSTFITDTLLDKAGISPFVGFSKSHVGDVDLVITTGAHGGYDNEEVRDAKIRKIPVITQGEAVGLFMNGSIFGRKDIVGISVAGSHGKTTTTAMIATIMKQCHLNPSFAIGTGDIPSLGSSGHYGRGRYFVAEADEYATEPNYDKTPKFLWQHPKIAVFTNLELDHPDIYSNVGQVREAFLKFAQNLAGDGLLVANGDDDQIKLVIKEHRGKVVTFGNSSQNDFYIKELKVSNSSTEFFVESKDANLGKFTISVPGEHNALNALASIIVALECGIAYEEIKKSIPAFRGTKRRFEYKGKLPQGALLYDDYAHHPTEIKKTLIAFRKSFPGFKLICVFQPHTYSRTKAFFNEFLHSFSDADIVIVTNIYPSLREEPDPHFSSKDLVDAMEKIHKNTILLKDLSSVVEYFKRNSFSSNTIVVTMGAGDIYKVAQELILKS